MRSEGSRVVTIWEPPDVSGLEDQVSKLSESAIKKAATQDASNGYPKVNSTDLYGIQSTVRDRATAACISLKDFFVRSRSQVLENLGVVCDVQAVEPIGNNVKQAKSYEGFAGRHAESFAEVHALRARSRAGILDCGVHALERERDLRVFREENQLLTGRAHYPETNTLNWAIVMFALLVETILNGSMFQHVADGLIGGILRASIFSIINVLLGLCLGFFGLKNLIHVSQARKIAGGLCVAVLVIVGIAWNGFVAHYRELAAESDGIGELDAARHMLTDPFDLTSVEAFALLFFGLIIFGAMAYKGYRSFDDPYPGYGKKDRIYRAASGAYEDEKQVLRDEVSAVFKGERARYESRLDHEQLCVRQAERLFENLSNHRADITASLDRVTNRANLLLRTYRDVNSRVRAGVVPKHFSESLTANAFFGGQDLTELMSVERVGDRVNAVRERREKNEPTLRWLIADTFDAEQAVHERLDEFFQEVHAEAVMQVESGSDEVETAGAVPGPAGA